MVRPKMTVAAHISCQHLVRLLPSSHIVSAPCPPPPDIDPFALPADAQTEDQKELKLFRRRTPDCYCIGAVLNQLSWSWRECVDNRQVAVCQLELHKLSSSEVRGFSMNEP